MVFPPFWIFCFYNDDSAPNRANMVLSEAKLAYHEEFFHDDTFSPNSLENTNT